MRKLREDALDQIKIAINQFREQHRNTGSWFDMRMIAVDTPFPYEQLIEKYGHEIKIDDYDYVTITYNNHTCGKDMSEFILFKDKCGYNMGFTYINFKEN